MSSLIDEYTKNKSPEDKKEIERRVREMGGNMSELSALMLVLEEMRKEKAKGGIMRLGFQDGTPDRQLYETPVTDAIKSVNEKTIDAIQKGGELFNEYAGINEVYDFPGVKLSATGAPSDFRHQAASNALAQALGKGKFTDPILGPISYLSGGIGSFGLGTAKEVIDFFKGVADPNMTTKEAFDQALEDTISNFKGAFAPAGTTSEELYAELMKDYQPIRTGMFDPFGLDQTAQIFMQRRKILDDAKKKQKDTIVPPQKPKRTTTTKPGTGGGGGRQVDTSRGAVRGAQQDISNYQDFGEVPLAKGGLARMLGE